MALRRRFDQRPLVGAGPKFRRLFLLAIATAVLLGLGIGIIWVIAGILHFHPLW
jgi:hypothetical protein